LRDGKGSTVTGVACSKKMDMHLGDTSGLEFKFYAPLTVVADGCFSKFRKDVINIQPITRSHFVGFILDYCPMPFPNHGHVLLAHPSPILVYQIGTHETRVLVDIPGQLPSAKEGGLIKYLTQVVLPQIPKEMRPSFSKAIESQRLRSMPNSFLPPSIQNISGLILLGDAQNMRHPLTGGGMTVAFFDVAILRELLSNLNFPTFHDRQEDILKATKLWYWKRKGLSSVVNILAMALYDLFSAGDDPDLEILRTATFNYLSLGGRCTNDPIGLLAGIFPKPLLLVIHFFSVAAFGAYCLFSQVPLYKYPTTAYRGARALYKSGEVMLPLIWSEFKDVGSWY